MKRLKSATKLIFSFAAGGLLAWAFWLEPNSLSIQRYSLTLPHQQTMGPLRIGIASDLHIGRYFGDEERLENIVKFLKKESPDLVVFLGDFAVQKDAQSFIRASHLLKDLNPPFGLYAVLGNHDWWSDQKAIVTALTAQNVRVIDNQIVQIQTESGVLQLVGFGDYWEDLRVGDFIKSLTPFSLPTIGLTHNPDIFPKLDPSLSLLLAGHTHGGQVKLPLLGAPMIPSKYGQRYRYGLIHENGHHLLVTSGTGNSILPVRFGVPPEIILLEVQFRPDSKGL